MRLVFEANLRKRLPAARLQVLIRAIEQVKTFSGSHPVSAGEALGNRIAPALRISGGFLAPPPAPKPLDPCSFLVWEEQTGNRDDWLRRVPVLGEAAALAAREIMQAWKEQRVSFSNAGRWDAVILPQRYVLLIDEPFGPDRLAAQRSANHMVEAAAATAPGARLLVFKDPRTRRGILETVSGRLRERLEYLPHDLHPAAALERAEAVCVFSSDLGFEAMLQGRPVLVHGRPFYAAWAANAPIPSEVPFENLVYSAFTRSALWLHPETGEQTSALEMIEWTGFQLRMRHRFPSRITAFGFAGWKRGSLRKFLAGSEVRFASRGKDLANLSEEVAAVWPSKFPVTAHPAGAPILRIEDGFLRSVGLGVELTAPQSWVIDPEGIHYDPRTVSTLERLLQEGGFDSLLLKRAAALRERIVEARLTKYNVGKAGWKRPPVDRRIVLVAGQVESDASVRCGATRFRTNADVLRAARMARPDAFLVYKPHPDVVARLRRRGSSEGEAASWCDEVVTDCAITDLFAQADEVHVLTSLAGFEALLREIPVVTYGQPFYAGWGLTTDAGLSDEVARRRSRGVSLDELTAAALILYPTYLSTHTGLFTTPERLLSELTALRDLPPAKSLYHRIYPLLARWFAD